MPKNNNIKKVLVIGSGPIIIGQAAEFDYSGTQACKALKEEGIKTILINSNPATIMTDKDIADKVYIEPLNSETVEKIIIREKPDSLLPNMGGQTGLNLAVELYDKGILDKYNVKIIGTSIENIKIGEDREKFRKLMKIIGEPIIDSASVSNLEEGFKTAKTIGYPLIVRPAYTLGGSGGGIAENEEELKKFITKGLNLSLNNQVLLEKSVKGYKEIEYEVMRDNSGNCINVCNMENIDPVGVHTGDSIVVAPSQTLSDIEYQMLRTASFKIIDAIDIKGGCNVQIALNPHNFEYKIIEINPRVSRSSALASKATGYPIAKVATKIALGYDLDEIENSVTKKTKACFEPVLDYVVTKIPKWPFDKFKKADRHLGTQMAATGEVMAIGKNFESSLLKAIRSLENNQFTLEHKDYTELNIIELKERLFKPHDELIFVASELLRRGYAIDKVHEFTGIDKFFVHKLNNIVIEEENLKTKTIQDINYNYLRKIKKLGFSDKGIAQLIKGNQLDILNLREKYNIIPSYKYVDTCSGEFEAVSPYYYSTYEEFDEVKVSNKKKIIVIGSGPIRIGQGVEFDYCCVHGVNALKKQNIESIIINNNPETVSTDFDVSDKLYFEPLTEEDVYNIIKKEKPDGVILQFGGQTAIKLAKFIDSLGVNIYGTSWKHIDTAEDREKFDNMLEKLSIKRPIGKGVTSLIEGLEIANKIGYPLLVRPSYVLGGQGMEIASNDDELTQHFNEAYKVDKENPILIDKYLNGIEVEVDAISDGENIIIPGIMEHLEKAGVHSGDSISIYPNISLNKNLEKEIESITKSIAIELNIKGIINIQFIISNGEPYVIEVNPRSSRTVPYISKVTKIPMVELAVRAMLGEKLKNLGYDYGLQKKIKGYTAKVPVFSSQKIENIEISLGPEMKSTGEALGIHDTYLGALYKGLIGADIKIPDKNLPILCTVKDEDKESLLNIAKRFKKFGYNFYATKGTTEYLGKNNIKSTVVKKISEERPNIIDVIKSGKICMVINTPTKANSSLTDGFKIRRAAVESNILTLTSLDTVYALLVVMEANIDKKELNIVELGEIIK
ncbi:MAG: carbamoyl-phosphate synthase large subunit [Bacillota bacterium]|nr:carbamoyl-phosphate synthase large subunit [Bacillota bacterium]